MAESCPKDKLPWNESNTCYYNDVTLNTDKSVISFDYDGTLVDFKTKEILDNVIETLQKLYEIYDIIIFSNQMGISKKKTTHKEVQEYFDSFIKLVNVPILIFYSTDNDNYRKPNKGMYDESHTIHKFDNILFYCGDAAGRDNDFSTSDLYFANNIGIPFKTPEEIFHNKIPKAIANKDTPKLELYKGDIWKDGKLSNPRKLFDIIHITENIELVPELDLSKKVIVFMIGSMGGGKSSLSKVLSNKYDLGVINLDTCSNLKKNKSSIKYYMENNSGIIIDNCNATKKTRSWWLNPKYIKNHEECKIYYIHFDIPKSISIHLSRYRTFHNCSKTIPMVAIHTFYKQLEIPTDERGTLLTINNPITIMNDYNHNYRFVWS